ncbi:MAG: hypothetical protein ACW97W_17500 [Candidatus Hodarchaeales archaeon]|jgi:hypothetical protein
MGKKTISKEGINKKCKTMVENMIKFTEEIGVGIGNKKNSRLSIAFIDSFYVRNQVNDDSCFGVGLTKESAMFDLAVLIEGETIYNPYTKQNFEVPHFSD